MSTSPIGNNPSTGSPPKKQKTQHTSPTSGRLSSLTTFIAKRALFKNTKTSHAITSSELKKATPLTPSTPLASSTAITPTIPIATTTQTSSSSNISSPLNSNELIKTFYDLLKYEKYLEAEKYFKQIESLNYDSFSNIYLKSFIYSQMGEACLALKKKTLAYKYFLQAFNDTPNTECSTLIKQELAIEITKLLFAFRQIEDAKQFLPYIKMAITDSDKFSKRASLYFEDYDKMKLCNLIGVLEYLLKNQDNATFYFLKAFQSGFKCFFGAIHSKDIEEQQAYNTTKANILLCGVKVTKYTNLFDDIFLLEKNLKKIGRFSIPHTKKIM